MRSSYRSSQQEVSQVLTCGIGTDVLIIARQHKTCTFLKKYDMSKDFTQEAFTELSPLKGLTLQSILPVDGLLDAVMGVTSSVFCMWLVQRRFMNYLSTLQSTY